MMVEYTLILIMAISLIFDNASLMLYLGILLIWYAIIKKDFTK